MCMNLCTSARKLQEPASTNAYLLEKLLHVFHSPVVQSPRTSLLQRPHELARATFAVYASETPLASLHVQVTELLMTLWAYYEFSVGFRRILLCHGSCSVLVTCDYALIDPLSKTECTHIATNIISCTILPEFCATARHYPRVVCALETLYRNRYAMREHLTVYQQPTKSINVDERTPGQPTAQGCAQSDSEARVTADPWMGRSAKSQRNPNESHQVCSNK